MSEGANTQRSSEQKEPESGGEQERFAGPYRETAVEDDNESGSDGGDYEYGGGEDGNKDENEVREGDDPQCDDDEEMEVTDFDEKPEGCTCDMYVLGGITIQWEYDEDCPVSKADHEAVYYGWYEQGREGEYLNKVVPMEVLIYIREVKLP
jgi:hypothetical protein